MSAGDGFLLFVLSFGRQVSFELEQNKVISRNKSTFHYNICPLHDAAPVITHHQVL